MFLLHLIITLCNSRMLIEIHCMCQPGVMQIFAFLLFIKHLVAQEWNVLSAWLLQVKCSQKNKTTDLKYNITQSSHAKQPCKKYWFHKTSQCCLPPPNYPKLSNTVSQSTMQNVSLKINTFDSVWKNEQRGKKKAHGTQFLCYFFLSVKWSLRLCTCSVIITVTLLEGTWL